MRASLLNSSFRIHPLRALVAPALLLTMTGIAQAANPVVFSIAPEPHLATVGDSATIAAPNAAHVAPVTHSASVRDIAGFGAPVGDASLLRFRGGDASTTDQDIDIRGGVDGNIAVGTVSGDNVIGGGAFGNAAGINTVIQNSGSNVLIQSGMNVNVRFGAPGQ